jgi:hypothetical protein
MAVPLTPATVNVSRSAEVPVAPDRTEAQQWADEELSHTEYQEKRPGPIVRFLRWLSEKLDQIDPAQAETPPWLFVVMVALSLITLLVALRMVGSPLNRTVTRPEEPIFSDPTLSAADHREAADRAAGVGDWATAVLERFRCVVRELEERAVIEPRPGRTAVETATEAARRQPELADRWRTAASAFDGVRYGGRPAFPTTDAQLRDLDARIGRTRVGPDTPTDPTALALPG